MTEVDRNAKAASSSPGGLKPIAALFILLTTQAYALVGLKKHGYKDKASAFLEYFLQVDPGLHPKKEDEMPMYSNTQTKTARISMMLIMISLIFSLVLPQSVAIAVPTGGETDSAAYDYSLIQRDFKSLKRTYARHKAAVKPLPKGLATLLQNYRILQDRGNKKWIDMRILFYDYNSYYQAAVSHQFEIELLLENHYGFDSKGKITNEPMAKYTVNKLRGAVVQMVSDIDNCKETLKKGKKLMKDNYVPDKGQKKNK